MILDPLGRLAGPITGAAGVAACAALTTLLILSSCENRFLKKAVAKAEQQAVQTQRELGVCQANRENLQASMVSQNVAVEAWRRTGEDVARDLKSAGEEARRSMLGATSRVATIMARTPSNGDACQQALEADKLIEEFVR